MAEHNYPGLDEPLQDEQLLEVFTRLTPALNDFAERHDLVVVRYKRGFAMWQFHFRHPKGGAGVIQANLGRNSQVVGASTWGSWWRDDHDRLQRRSLDDKVSEYDVEPEPGAVVAALERALSKLLAAEPGSLNQVSMLMPRLRHPDGRFMVGLLDVENLPVAR